MEQAPVAADNENRPAPIAPANGDVGDVFRLRERYRNLGLACLILFVLVGIGSAYGMWREAPPDRRIYAVVFVSVCCGFFAGLSVWMLLAYWLERLTIRNGEVIQQGVFRTREIDVQEVREARWKLDHSGSIRLRTLTEKLTIYCDNFDPNERLWLVRYFRERLPESVQEDWDNFCYRIAVPLREYDPAECPKPRPDNAVLTRSRWDCYFLPFVLVVAIYGVWVWLVFQQPRMLLAPIVPAALWMVLRFSTPKRGMAARRISADPEHQRFLIFELWWMGVAIAGLVIFKLVKLPMPQGLVAAIIAGVRWFAVFAWRARKVDRARQPREDEAVRRSVQQWSESEQSH